MERTARNYLPAAAFDWALPLYDPLSLLLGLDSARRNFALRTALTPGFRILDIGCGTGTLAVFLKRRYPAVEMLGLDPDTKILMRGQQKARRGEAAVHLIRAFADELPLPERSVDAVFSSFMFHHLKPEEKEKTLRAVLRVLRPGGSLLLLDFARVKFNQDGFLARLWPPTQHLKDQNEGQILSLMRQAGFVSLGVTGRHNVIFGLSEAVAYVASAPAS